VANLSKFMLSMANNPLLQQQFKNDPHGAMTGAGLSSGDIAAVLSKNPSVIQNALSGGVGGASAAAASDIVVVVVI
jgi:hypothetical protein